MNLRKLDKNYKKRIIEDSFFPVAKVPLKGSKTHYQILNSKTNEVLEKVARRTAFVHNRQIVEPFIKYFGLDALTHYFSQSVNRVHTYTFETGRKFTISKDDEIKEQIIVENSYTSQRSFRFLFGAYRSAGCNQLFFRHSIIACYSFRVGHVPIHEIIHSVLNHYKDNDYALWKKFAEYALTKDEELELIKNCDALKPRNIYDKHKAVRGTTYEPHDSHFMHRCVTEATSRLIEQHESVNNARNAWGLYNQFNKAVANIRGFRKLSLDRKRISANMMIEKYIMDALGITTAGKE